MRKQTKKMISICVALAMSVSMSAFPWEAAAAGGVHLNHTKISLVKKKSITLRVKGSYKKVLWSSQNKKIAAVTKKGKVTAKKTGKTMIIAKITQNHQKKKILKCRVTVKKQPRSLTTTVPASYVTPTVTINISPLTTPTAAPLFSISTATPATAPVSTATSAPTILPYSSAAPLPVATPATAGQYTSTAVPYTLPASYSTFASTVKAAGENNPILTNSYACDPYAMEYNGRLYVYMTNDSQQYESGNRVKTNQYGKIQSMHIISTDDMVNWTDHGIYQIAGNDGICKWAGCCWAPCAVHKKVNGKDKFFIYFTNGGYQLGMVAADSPIGPFTDYKGSALAGPQTNNSVGTQALDPAAFIDDDGTAYLTFGGDNGGMLYQLGDDMKSFVGQGVKLNAPYMYEDSGINKIGDKYYYSYCSDWKERSDDYKNKLGVCSIGYMMSDHVKGPYTYVGDVLPNCGTVFGVFGNNHHSIVSFQGEYYMFYHTRVLETALGCDLGYQSVHANKLEVNSDGTLTQVAQDLKGLDQIASFNPYQETSGTTSNHCGGMMTIHTNIDGAYMEPIYQPDQYQYSWSSIKAANFGETSPSSFTAKLAGPANGTGNMKVCLDSLTGTTVVDTNVTFDANGNASLSVPVKEITGVHDIYFELNGKMYDFASWQFQQ